MKLYWRVRNSLDAQVFGSEGCTNNYDRHSADVVLHIRMTITPVVVSATQTVAAEEIREAFSTMKVRMPIVGAYYFQLTFLIAVARANNYAFLHT
ncbi:transmembrane protein, putative [Bodo saltans]|uniref:Transmembrane protein, putative n=1 Tax=Bodo saltans TaxID=75058 RepID=A0A0S4JHY2_BODSA|nr:transmembrane protein, putative [Bodo saltans]|eukprot:CUG88015.1 transmembrane protein, putative [Bodo saltans]